MHRIVQWGTGFIGVVATKAILDHPDMELVGCHAFSQDKIGQDVGTLVGRPPIGVTATGTVEEIIELKPDCVLYMPIQWDVDAMVALLEAGINIVSTANFITGASYGEAERARIEAAAVKGGVTVYGSGINPGFANALGLMATAVCKRVDRVSVLESVDATPYASPDSWHSLGFGGPVHDGLPAIVKERSLVFIDAVELMAKALRVTIDDIAFSVEFGLADHDLALGYMDIPAGTICGVKMVYSGVIKGRNAIELGLMWRLGDAMTPDWRPEEGYIVEVDGDPSVRCTYMVTGEGALNGLSTAMPAVNSIPAVVAARSGIVDVNELPMIIAVGAVA